MKILAIETSGLDASVALADADQLLAESILDTAGRRSARMLVPAVGEMLQQFSLRPGQIDVVAVSVGPGSFTGLRVGVVFAKTFAWINNTKLVAVDTLQAVAQRVLPTDRTITVITDAQRGDAFVNSYRGQEIVHPLGTVRIEGLERILKTVQEQADSLLTGSGVDRFNDQIPESIAVAAHDFRLPRASALFPLAFDMIGRGMWSDPDTIEPVYLRRSYAEEKRDAQR
ncbi:MAG: tRNA (adenosine(37)-N6)-threonylcarbamoyltransferase complex dimerization subunit type 1 TsaB [Fuerstiella sp.]|nr:tRNA (adenosine(37)-N6)-threonylcarbamoyltransferase complex dimerization subunit type 1 TsaB [Fuerstiella sp.]